MHVGVRAVQSNWQIRFRRTAQNRIGFLGGVVPSKVVRGSRLLAFYAISALVAALGLAILITSATVAYVVAQSFK